MKIWIDENNTSPADHRWCRNVREAITAIQQADLSIGRALRNHNIDDAGLEYERCQKIAENFRIKEINISNNMIGGRDHDMLMVYLEELGRKDQYDMKVH